MGRCEDRYSKINSHCNLLLILSNDLDATIMYGEYNYSFL